jgi:hypothetical protein
MIAHAELLPDSCGYPFKRPAIGWEAGSERAFPQLPLERSSLGRRQLRRPTSRHAMLEPSGAAPALAFGPLTNGCATDAESSRDLRL